MEYLSFWGKVFFLIISHTTIFMTVQIKGCACEPLWIWAKGCKKEMVNSTRVLNQTNNLPDTCFEACGELTSTIALQGNLCSCNSKTSKRARPSECRPCDMNEQVACGDVSNGYWSVYEKANLQELKDHGIPLNATGCIASSYDHGFKFYVEDCSRSRMGSICTGAFNIRNTGCSSSNTTWSTHACNTGNNHDILVDTFAALDYLNVNICPKQYWIGLLSLNKTSGQFGTSLYESSETTLYPSLREVSTSAAAISFINLPDISSSSVQMDSSVLEYHFESNDLSVQITPTSLYPANVLVEQTPSHVLTETSWTDVYTSFVNSQIESTHSHRLSRTCTTFNVPFTSISTAYTELPHASVTPTLKYVPVLSSLISHPSTVYSTMRGSSDHVLTSASSENLKTKLSPTKSSYVESTILRPTEIVHTIPSVDRSLHKHHKAPKGKELGHASLKDITSSATTQLLPSKQTPSKTAYMSPGSSARTGSNANNLDIVVIVIGVIAVIALAAVIVLVMYLKRSIDSIKLKQKRMTTLTDDPINHDRESSFNTENENDRELSNNSFSGISSPSNFSAARRADLRTQSTWSSDLNNGSRAQENDYVLY